MSNSHTRLLNPPLEERVKLVRIKDGRVYWNKKTGSAVQTVYGCRDGTQCKAIDCFPGLGKPDPRSEVGRLFGRCGCGAYLFGEDGTRRQDDRVRRVPPLLEDTGHRRDQGRAMKWRRVESKIGRICCIGRPWRMRSEGGKRRRLREWQQGAFDDDPKAAENSAGSAIWWIYPVPCIRRRGRESRPDGTGGEMNVTGIHQSLVVSDKEGWP